MNTDDVAEVNSRRVVEILAENGKLITEYKEADFLFLGRFLTLVLLLENAIDKAISRVKSDSPRQMLGRKIDLLKDLTKELKVSGIDTGDWDRLVAPLKELSNVRGKIAHKINKKAFDPGELRQVKAYAKRQRRDLYDQFEKVEIAAREKDLSHLVTFVWCAMERLCFLQHQLNG